ncbi:MAG: 4Fe-4S dicluster domain-containing protein [Oscillospiraceae bacterium]|nr:4Fe-4S dicluster domain-containing protein [Oscillospiraceae bacterium]
MQKLSMEKLDELFRKMSEKQAVYLPVDKENGAKFEKWSEGTKMSQALNTIRSAKDFIFPQTENLVDFKVNGKNIEVADTREECEDFVIFGMKACDARSFGILDKVFLSEPVDTYYKNRREHGVLVTLACTKPSETCFCQTFGINPAEPEGDVSTWIADGEMYFEANTEKGKTFIESISDMLEDCGTEKVDAQKAKINEIMRKLPLNNLKTDAFGGDKLNELFNSPKWAELSESCLGCGTCTFVCPTCQCYDIKDFDCGNGVKRFRCWDSCMYSDFTRMAHGNSRNSQLERFRQRFMHKLVYFPANNDGEFGCVGCGRCLAKCPISMNIVKVMKALEG